MQYTVRSLKPLGKLSYNQWRKNFHWVSHCGEYWSANGARENTWLNPPPSSSRRAFLPPYLDLQFLLIDSCIFQLVFPHYWKKNAWYLKSGKISFILRWLGKSLALSSTVSKISSIKFSFRFWYFFLIQFYLVVADPLPLFHLAGDTPHFFQKSQQFWGAVWGGREAACD